MGNADKPTSKLPTKNFSKFSLSTIKTLIHLSCALVNHYQRDWGQEKQELKKNVYLFVAEKKTLQLSVPVICKATCEIQEKDKGRTSHDSIGFFCCKRGMMNVVIRDIILR